MSVAFASADVLWGLVLLPLFWALARRRQRRAGVRGHVGHLAIRSLLLALLVVGLSDPSMRVSADRVALVHAVDLSDSVATGSLARVADLIDRVNQEVKPSVSTIVGFAGREERLADTDVLRRMARGTDRNVGTTSLQLDLTDLEHALMTAQAEIPPGMSGRVLVYSDGRETQGDARHAAARLAAAGVPVFPAALSTRQVADTWVEAVTIADRPVAGAATPVQVALGSHVRGEARVEIRSGGRVLGRKDAVLETAATVVTVDVVFTTPGLHLVDAEVIQTGDSLGDNNTLTTAVTVGAAPRVLYVQRAGSGDVVAQAALVQSGMTVSVATPQELRADRAAYERFDVVVLSDLAAAELPEPVMEALSAWVEQQGGGLLFAGGSRVVGEAPDRTMRGYRHSAIERILPVTFDRDDQADVALVIVLDRSWSMNGLAMDLSKAAAEAAANTLAPSQMLGILSFSSDATWNVPLGRVRETRSSWHDAIQRITASGPTAIYPALEQAFVALADVRARAKHVVLLSDGRQDPDDFEGLVKKMAAARITVSSVALGAEADVDLLDGIARWGGGRAYVVDGAQQIPAIFVTEARSATDGKSGDASGLALSVKHPDLFPRGGSGMPRLTGRNEVTRKPQAIELLGSSAGDPILTVWPAGLGRTAMLAVDLGGGWSGEWLRWRGFGGTVASIVQALAPEPGGAASMDVSVESRLGTAETVHVSLDLRHEGHRDPQAAPPDVRVRREASTVLLALAQTAEARFSASTAVDASRPVIVEYGGRPGAPVVSQALVIDRAAEYRFGPPNRTLLEDLARVTGGTIDPDPARVASAAPRSGTVQRLLGPWVLVAALLLWFADVVARRRWR